METVFEFFGDYTMRTVALGCALLGIVAGALGPFAVLRRQSLMGDAVSHAALPGIVAAFLITGSKEPLILMIGAAIAGWLSMIAVINITGNTRVKYDAALGISLSVFFGFGMVLLTFAQKSPDAAQAGLSKFLFGQAAAMVMADVRLLFALGLASLTILAIFWKEFKILSFNRDFADTIGYSTSKLDLILTSLIVVSIVIGLQTVGVVLMSAMIVAPAAAARQWTDRLGAMVTLSAFIGALSGIAGATLSGVAPHIPTGPAIVLSSIAFVLISILFASNRGIIWNLIRSANSLRLVRLEGVLESILLLAENHERLDHPHERDAVLAIAKSRGANARTIGQLERRGWVCIDTAGLLCLTESGIEEARRFRSSITGGGGEL